MTGMNHEIEIRDIEVCLVLGSCVAYPNLDFLNGFTASEDVKNLCKIVDQMEVGLYNLFKGSENSTAFALGIVERSFKRAFGLDGGLDKEYFRPFYESVVEDSRDIIRQPGYRLLDLHEFYSALDLELESFLELHRETEKPESLNKAILDIKRMASKLGMYKSPKQESTKGLER